MPKITFNDSDFAKMQPPAKGFHLFEITDTSEKLSNKGDSTNYNFFFKAVESAVNDANIGRTADRGFNSKALGFMTDFLAAVWQCTPDEAVTKLRENPELDTSELVGEKVWNEVIDEVYEGRSIRKMSDTWASAAAQPPF